jgi:RimJ/RimL family protein N-acetyltransferase
VKLPPKDDGEQLTVELAPLTEDVMGEFIAQGGMQSHSVVRFLARRYSPVLKDEFEWFEKVRTDKDSMIWGIWVYQDSERHLIGTTGLNSIEYGPTGMKQATSGVLIFDQNFWGKGIASSIHKARTWFAFTELGLTRIKSAVIQGNDASRKALEKSGYTFVYEERNTSFTGGGMRHQDNLECINPLEPFWSNWWGVDTPNKQAQAARKVTKEALAWAKQHVTLP